MVKQTGPSVRASFESKGRKARAVKSPAPSVLLTVEAPPVPAFQPRRPRTRSRGKAKKRVLQQGRPRPYNFGKSLGPPPPPPPPPTGLVSQGGDDDEFIPDPNEKIGPEEFVPVKRVHNKRPIVYVDDLKLRRRVARRRGNTVLRKTRELGILTGCQIMTFVMDPDRDARTGDIRIYYSISAGPFATFFEKNKGIVIYRLVETLAENGALPREMQVRVDTAIPLHPDDEDVNDDFQDDDNGAYDSEDDEGDEEEEEPPPNGTLPPPPQKYRDLPFDGAGAFIGENPDSIFEPYEPRPFVVNFFRPPPPPPFPPGLAFAPPPPPFPPGDAFAPPPPPFPPGLGSAPPPPPPFPTGPTRFSHPPPGHVFPRFNDDDNPFALNDDVDDEERVGATSLEGAGDSSLGPLNPGLGGLDPLNTGLDVLGPDPFSPDYDPFNPGVDPLDRHGLDVDVG